MAGRGGIMQVAAAAGVAAGTGAAQLGLGYGLGVVVWPVTPGADDSVWLGSLGWATWIAASSTVFGTVVAGRLREARTGPWRRAAPALSAAVGALLTVALIALPARFTVRPQTASPETVAAGYALAGVLIGLVIAYWAVSSRPVAANLMVTAAYLWALAAAAIVVELLSGRDTATYLTSWQFADVGDGRLYGTIYWPSALLTLLAALLIGMVAVWPAMRRGHFGVGAATSGAVGPLLVAAAFLVLAPRLTGALGQLGSAYLIAPYAVLAGLAGSAFVVAAGQRAAERRKRRHHRPAPPSATGVAAVHVPDGAGGDGTSAGAHPAVPDHHADRRRSEPDGGPVTGAGRPGSPEPDTAELAQIRPRTDPVASARPAGPATEQVHARARPAAEAGPPAQARTPTQPGPGRPETAAEREQTWGGTGAGGPAGPGPGTGPAATGGQATPSPRGNRSTGGATAAKAERGSAATPDPRSTVAAPPASPPVAKINPPRAAGGS